MWIKKSKNKSIKLIQYLCLMGVQAYKVFFSIYFRGQCRFVPSCSTYCLESLRSHSLGRALRLSFIRLAKCQPFYRGSAYDPVPERASRRARYTDE